MYIRYSSFSSVALY